MAGSAFRTWLRRIWIGGGLLFTAWLAWNLQASGVPASAFVSDPALNVSAHDDHVLFTPQHPAPPPRVALVFLPGGLVDPDAYVPVVRAIAATGIPSALVKMPWRSAATETMRDTLWTRILTAHDRLGRDRPLVVAGHSRGAALAARFAAGHGDIDGLVLIGTTHPRDQDLSSARYPVLKIMGSRDCVAPPDAARAHAARLPTGTQWLTIAGANHAQFGYYGSQINDCRAEIDRDTQQRKLIEAVTAFLASIG